MLANQLDFIFFFYGLAFILLGITCWTTARGVGRRGAWGALGGFGLVHGIGEWFDLAALVVGDSAVFAAARTALMTVSFVLLLEFARLEAARLGARVPGRWVHVALLSLVVAMGVLHGTAAANAVARYAIGFVGAAATSLVLARLADTLPDGARNYAISAAIAFLLYAVSAGLIVPAAPFWPADTLNQAGFAALTGLPAQLVRGLLACWISFCVWAVWSEQVAAEVSSSRFTSFIHGQFVRTLVVLGGIMVAGWTLTEFLGGIYREDVQEQAAGDLDLIASRLSVERAAVDAMTMALAGSPSVLPVLAGDPEEPATARRILQRAVDLAARAAGARHGAVSDASGVVIASTSPDASARVPEIRAMASAAGGDGDGHGFVFDPAAGRPHYYAVRPVRADDGRTLGSAMLMRPLDGFEADLRSFDRPYFLADPHGIVVLSNRPAALFRPLWPIEPATWAQLTHRYGRLGARPLLGTQVDEAAWTRVDGSPDYVRREVVDDSGWSLVIFEPSREIFASRFLGIVITLLTALTALIYLIGRGRWMHDDIQAGQRLQLQALAQDLGVKATTDPLTGLHNRLMLEHTLAAEMARAQRYEMPLSIVMYDVDRFKRVNDTHGHAAGDQVLIQLARLVPGVIRNTDLLVRWGGEEFLILMPGSDAHSAGLAAEKVREAIARATFPGVGPITCSFGVAQYLSGETAEALVARADEALYRAKHEGRNRVRVSSDAPQPAPRST
jgi:diguanylate cyclase (GGDEF)-like protein